MRLIKLFLIAVSIMFIFLFLIFVMYIQKNTKIKEYEPEIIETIADESSIENPILENPTIEIPAEEPSAVSIEPVQENLQEEIIGYTSKDKYYYTSLDEYSKMIYDGVETQKESLKNGNSVIYLSDNVGRAVESGIVAEEIFSAGISAFENDNPDLFYIKPSKIVLYYEKNNLGNYRVYLKNGDEYTNYYLDSFKNKTEVQDAKNKIDLVVQEILEVTNNMYNDYDKILYVHDWLTSNVKYDETINRVNKDTIYGALVEKEAVCGGYAKAFKYIMDKIGIKTIVVEGVGISENGQENHAWNYVELNGKWYGIDCTWDDPIIIGDTVNYTEKRYYTYFLKGQNIFLSTHKPFEKFYETNIRITYPELSIEDY